MLKNQDQDNTQLAAWFVLNCHLFDLKFQNTGEHQLTYVGATLTQNHHPKTKLILPFEKFMGDIAEIKKQVEDFQKGKRRITKFRQLRMQEFSFTEQMEAILDFFLHLCDYMRTHPEALVFETPSVRMIANENYSQINFHFTIDNGEMGVEEFDIRYKDGEINFELNIPKEHECKETYLTIVLYCRSLMSMVRDYLFENSIFPESMIGKVMSIEKTTDAFIKRCGEIHTAGNKLAEFLDVEIPNTY